MQTIFNSALKFFFIAAFCFVVATSAAATQTRQTKSGDHLTAQEADLVRDEQRIDKRTEIFVKAIDRRMLAIAPPTARNSEDVKRLAKDDEKFGALTATTHAQHLADVTRILDEAITNIDDASERARQKELLPKALRKLSDAATRYLAQLTPMRASADDSTRVSLERAIELSQTIVDAAAQKAQN